MRRNRDPRTAAFSVGLVLALASMGLVAPAAAVDNDTCLDCHDDPTLDTRRGGRVVSLNVDPTALDGTVHEGFDCIDCHTDADVDEFPHPEFLRPVDCADCHDDAKTAFDASIHGQALRRDAPYAPNCSDCHGTHEIRRSTDPKARTYKMNVPVTCGGCHREGAPVARFYDIPEKDILDNYSQSIHGEGLFKKGLIVSAACTDCHGSHGILPHDDPTSSISPAHIAATCMNCHARIEDVHAQVIRGELWESAPGAIPACTDCHRPHKVRKESLALTISDLDCLECHTDVAKLASTPVGHGAGMPDSLDPASYLVDRDQLLASAHTDIPCVKCHSDVDPRLDRPCEPSGLVDCSNCHARTSSEYAASSHGRSHAAGMEAAPYCTDCHGDHGVLSHRDENAPTFRAAVPQLCGECHREDGAAVKAAPQDLAERDALTDYSSSVHGRGLTEKGLLPSAICIDCHGTHLVLGVQDELSSINPRNLPSTCASCHRGIYQQYVGSVHFDDGSRREKQPLPTCTNCHSSHTIAEVEKDAFLTEVTDQCGSCHEDLAETYLDTMHGKAYRLGYLGAARCSDCHGAHHILAVNDPESTVGFRNIVNTCRNCHEDATERFTGYLTHATHHDKVKYPVLYWTYWAMTSLLVGVFSFFGIHTLMWLPRSFAALRDRRRRERTEAEAGNLHWIRRFSTSQRITHFFVIVSFLSLAGTGMMLKFSSMPWTSTLAAMLGGVRNAGVIHRTAAVITFGYFAFHLVMLARHKRRRRLSLVQLTLGKNSMMFNKKDILDFIGTVKWFFGKGPRPEYGRWTYWEKFDYLAVFWGVAVIGLSGLMLWFPEFFTRFLPGWLINVATIIHSDEALLAVGFIFTVHFFNTHLRPEAFPMDMVVFTGVSPLEEYRRDRPEEYAEMKRTGELRKRVTRQGPSRRLRTASRIFGFAALGIGLVLVALIIYSMLFGYH